MPDSSWLKWAELAERNGAHPAVVKFVRENHEMLDMKHLVVREVALNRFISARDNVDYLQSWLSGHVLDCSPETLVEVSVEIVRQQRIADRWLKKVWR